MDLQTALKGMLDAQDKLSTPEVMASPVLISEQMYRLGQYTSAVERELGDIEEEYEINWSDDYRRALEDKMSVTAAKQHADVENSEDKGQIKRLSRYVSSSWKVHTQCMARYNHLTQENRGAV